MRPTIPLLAVLLGFVVQTSARADIIHVPADYSTIQAAIDAAVDDDEIVVAPGTYNETIDFSGKAITVRSSDDPEFTTIDGTGLNDSVIKCINGEGNETVLQGFTITGGTGEIPPPGGPSRGGGMYNTGSSPTVTNCTFSGNSAGMGGGMANQNNSSPTVTNCAFAGNATTSSDSNAGGAGMYNYNSSPVVNNCLFVGNTVNNSVGGNGGGMANRNNSSPTLTNSTFTGNSSSGRGGGLHNDNGSSPTVENCTFTSNIALGGGGMANLNNANPLVLNCTFAANVATQGQWGGGMWSQDSSPILTDCSFLQNSASLGGGMYFSSGEPILTGCKFIMNSAVRGGGLRIAGNSSVTVTNCTFSGNSADTGGGIYKGAVGSLVLNNCILWGDIPDEIDSGVGATVRYSNIEGGWAGEGNIDSDPLFADPDTYDYHLQSGSPCIDAADSSAVPPDIETDLDGNPRFVNDPDADDTGTGNCPFVDMGAFEYQEGVAGCCPADLDGDGAVGPFDLALVLGFWGPNPGHPSDINGDGEVGPLDLALVLGNWGPCE